MYSARHVVLLCGVHGAGESAASHTCPWSACSRSCLGACSCPPLAAHRVQRDSFWRKVVMGVPRQACIRARQMISGCIDGIACSTIALYTLLYSCAENALKDSLYDFVITV